MVSYIRKYVIVIRKDNMFMLLLLFNLIGMMSYISKVLIAGLSLGKMEQRNRL